MKEIGCSTVVPGRPDWRSWLGVPNADESGRSGYEGLRSWWGFPNPKRPRVLVPCDASAWSAALDMLSYTRHARWIRHALPVLRAVRFPSQAVGPASGSPLDQWVERVLGFAHASYTIYVGSGSTYRKDTVQVCDPAGVVRAYVKIPVGPGALQALDNESTWLVRLKERFPDETWYPRVLGSEGGLVATSGPPASGSSGPATIGAAALTCGRLSQFGTQSFKWDESPVRCRVADVIAGRHGNIDPEVASLLRRALDHCSDAFEGRTVEHFFSHGDFLPWNTRNSGDNAYVFDLEWAGWRMKLYDVFHYLVVPNLAGTKVIEPGLLDPWQSPEGLALVGSMPRPLLGELLCLQIAFVAEQLAFHQLNCLENGDDSAGLRILDVLKQLLGRMVA